MPLVLIPADRLLLQALVAKPTAALDQICKNGTAIRAVVDAVAHQTIALYDRTGCEPPWHSYLARDDSIIIGTCAFTSSPTDRAVEIAYFTFPPYKARGYATEMAGLLLEIAAHERELFTVIAHTLSEENASTRILRKLGFHHEGHSIDPDAGEVWRWRRSNLLGNANSAPSTDESPS